jgi:nucleotide-binding universal stress UspA family protein
MPQHILVGVDDSPAVDRTLQWAADDARVRRLPLRLVYAFRWEATRIPGYVESAEIPDLQVRGSQSIADEVIEPAVDTALELEPGVDVSGDAADGDPARVLIEESEQAREVVLGSRHNKALGSAVLGSVSAAVTARAACPVVVVRGPSSPEPGAGVVIGVDDTETSEQVLAYGFDYASWHGLPVRPVLCWHPDLLALKSRRAEPPAPARVEAWLSEALAGWQERYPDVAVHPEVVREYPVAGLVGASTGQNLLVVGRRGRHALSGTLLGSVSQGVLHHATPPVAVVPTHR